MTFTAMGTLLSVLFGLAHAAYVFTVVATRGGTVTVYRHAPALYAAAWTLLLWLLFGTYLLLFWVVGGVLLLISRWRR